MSQVFKSPGIRIREAMALSQSVAREAMALSQSVAREAMALSQSVVREAIALSQSVVIDRGDRVLHPEDGHLHIPPH